MQEASAPGVFTPLANAPTTAPLPTIPASGGTYGGTIAVPPASVQAQVTVQLLLTPPSGVSALSFAHRAALRRFTTTNTPLLYITMTAGSSTVTFTGFPGFTISVPSGAGTGPFYLAQLEGTTWTTVAGPDSLSGGSVTLQPSLPSLTIPPNTTLVFCLYTGGVVPSAAPTGSPGGQPTASTSPVTSPTASSSSSASPTALPTGSTPTPVSSPTSSPTVAPTATSHPTSSPTSFPTASPTASPTVAPNGSPPATFVMGTPYPSVNWGDATSVNGSPISGFEVLDSSGNKITGTFSHAVTVSSNSSAVTLSILGSAAASSVTLTSGSQLLALTYNGAATNAVTISASATGATSNSAQFTPTSQPIVYSGPTVSGSPEIDLYAPSGQGTGSTYSFTATQAGYTGSTYGNTLGLTVPTACNAFASVVQSGTSFTVTATAAPTAGSCTIVLGGFGTTTLSVKLTYTSLGVILQ